VVDKDDKEDDETVNYWDKATKRRESMQGKYKQDLLELMKYRMLHLYLCFFYFFVFLSFLPRKYFDFEE
jgi:hypothetical protein